MAASRQATQAEERGRQAARDIVAAWSETPSQTGSAWIPFDLNAAAEPTNAPQFTSLYWPLRLIDLCKCVLKRCSLKQLSALRREFQGNCVMRLDQDASPIRTMGSTEVTTCFVRVQCFVARMCLCRTRELRRFALYVKELMATLEHHGKRESLLRELTEKGLAVVQLRQKGQVQTYFHLSWVNFGNWFAVLMPLDISADRFRREAALGMRRKAVEVRTGVPLFGLDTWWRCLHPVVDTAREAQVDIWTIAMSGEETADLPCRLQIEPPMEKMSFPFWPPRPRRTHPNDLLVRQQHRQASRANGELVAKQPRPRKEPGHVKPPVVAVDEPAPGVAGGGAGIPPLEGIDLGAPTIVWHPPSDGESGPEADLPDSDADGGGEEEDAPPPLPPPADAPPPEGPVCPGAAEPPAPSGRAPPPSEGDDPTAKKVTPKSQLPRVDRKERRAGDDGWPQLLLSAEAGPCGHDRIKLTQNKDGYKDMRAICGTCGATRTRIGRPSRQDGPFRDAQGRGLGTSCAFIWEFHCTGDRNAHRDWDATYDRRVPSRKRFMREYGASVTQ